LGFVTREEEALMSQGKAKNRKARQQVKRTSVDERSSKEALAQMQADIDQAKSEGLVEGTRTFDPGAPYTVPVDWRESQLGMVHNGGLRGRIRRWRINHWSDKTFDRKLAAHARRAVVKGR
jgi:hypothetical protein